MSKQIASSNLSHLPAIPLKNQAKEKCLITCPIFKNELQAVLDVLGKTPEIRYMHYTIHNNPGVMEQELSEKLSHAKKAGENIRFLVGKNCHSKKNIVEIANSCDGRIPMARNCIEILIGKEKTRKLQKNRTSVMTPAWISMINQSINDGQWTVEDARINLGWYNQILILDTGVEPLDDELIMEFFDLIQVPIDILPVDLAYFSEVIEDLLQ